MTKIIKSKELNVFTCLIIEKEKNNNSDDDKNNRIIIILNEKDIEIYRLIKTNDNPPNSIGEKEVLKF